MDIRKCTPNTCGFLIILFMVVVAQQVSPVMDRVPVSKDWIRIICDAKIS